MSTSAAFDQSFYLSNNTDVLIAISQGIFSSAQQHYDLFGGKELRDPNADFNATYYAAQNPDVLNAVASGVFPNVFSHYQAFGESESRVPSSAYAGFDATSYLAANADVAAAITAGNFTSALDHYLTFGQSENREGSGVSATITTGNTLVLTTGVDNLTGGTANDLFTAINEANVAAGDTLSVADTLDGGAGTDTLNITNTQQGALAGLTTSNIENLVIRSTNSDNTVETLNLTSLVGVNNVTLDDLTDGVEVSNATLGTVFNITDVNATNVADVITLGYASATGSSDSGTINTSNVTVASLVSDSLDTITVNNTGSQRSTLTLFDAGDAETVTWNNTTASVGSNPGLTVTDDNDNVATTYNFTGSGTTTFTSAMSTALTTVDGSAATGALDLNVSSNTNNLTLSTGSGDDRVELGLLGTNFSSATNDSVNLGDGTDTMVVTDTAFTAGDITLIKAVTSAEVIEFASTTAETTVDFNTVSVIDSFKFAGVITDAAGANGVGAGAAGASADNAALILTGVESSDSITLSANMTGGAGGNGVAGGSANPGGAGGAGGNASAAVSLAVDVDGGQNAITINLDGGITITGGAGGTGAAGGAAASGNNNGGAGGAGGNGAAAISAGNFETITINSTGTTANAIAGGAAGAGGAGGGEAGGGTAGAAGAAGTAGSSIIINTNGTINVTGTRDINLGTVQGTNLSVDASTFTGKLTVVAEAGNNIITGGSKVDTITGAGGQDTITGGEGNDIFIVVDNQSTTAAADTITDFGLNGDIIRLAAADDVAGVSAAGTTATTNVEVSSGGKVTFATADDTLAEKLVAIAADTTDIAANEVAFFEHGSDTYIFNNIGATDDLIKLTGITGATTLTESTTTAGDFTLA